MVFRTLFTELVCPQRLPTNLYTLDLIRDCQGSTLRMLEYHFQFVRSQTSFELDRFISRLPVGTIWWIGADSNRQPYLLLNQD